jgi:hypothetical protein
VGEPGKLDILLLYDDSLSMAVVTFAWIPVTEAINAFINAPESAGIGVGLKWFSNGCSAAEFTVPDVPIADLPGNAAAVSGAIQTHLPAGSSTQTMYAIQGATEFARQRAGDYPETKVIILIVTDGNPEAGVGDSCPGGDSDITNTSQAAADAFNGDPSIPVYVVGAGFSLQNLNQIASSGGTGQAFIADPALGSQPLIDALNAIRGDALPCFFAVPAEYSQYNDPDLVNLAHNGEPIGQVAGADQCDPVQGGWYYDNPAAPTRINTCDQTCQKLAEGGSVDVVLGCPTVKIE